jgi:hypothetical protein
MLDLIQVLNAVFQQGQPIQLNLKYVLLGLDLPLALELLHREIQFHLLQLLFLEVRLIFHFKMQQLERVFLINGNPLQHRQ